MFRQLLKGVAVVVGAGVAASVIVSRSLDKLPSRKQNTLEDDAAFQPLLNRLDRIETRITQVEHAHARDIDLIRERTVAASQSMNNGVTAIGDRLEEVTESLPALLESIVVARAEDLRLKLRAEVQQSVNGSLASFERVIDEKVSSRISLLESTMLDHSEAMAQISQRMLEFDVKLQRLMSEIERVSSSDSAKPLARGENLSEMTKSGAAA
jgi:prefoldin subunit 5